MNRTNLVQWVTEATEDGTCAADTAIVVASAQGDANEAQVVHGTVGGPSARIVDRHTLFPVGSLTKAMTATLLLVLQDHGIIDIDAPINESEVLFRMDVPLATANVTLRDILQHKTGIPTNDLLWIFSSFNAEQIRNAIGHLESVSDGYRRVFAYNNLAYACIGPILTERMGRRYEDLVNEFILQPLGMDDTCFGASPGGHGNFARPSNDDGSLFFRRTDHIAPAGGIVSNLNDMTKWLRFLVSRGKSPSGDQLISEIAFEDMVTSVFPLTPPFPLFLNGWEWSGRELSYGLGHFVGSVANEDVFFHPGLLDGYSTGIGVIPARREGIVVLCNANMSQVPPSIVGRFASAVVAGANGDRAQELADTAWNGEGDAAPPRPSHEPPEGIEGVYANGAYGTLVVSREDTGLFILYNDERWKLEMVTDENGTFTVWAFGIGIPLGLRYDQNENRIYIPFSLDDRVRPFLFEKTA